MKMYMKSIFAMALVMALTLAITLSITTTKREEELSVEVKDESISTTLVEDTIPVIRASRFLAEKSLRPPKFHCNKDYDVCSENGSPGFTCCSNKCVDLMIDDKYCGNCKIKCKHTQACCNRKCVYLSFDKRHCGACGNKCMEGGYCIYGMCDYA